MQSTLQHIPPKYGCLLILSILPVVLHCTHRELTSLMTKSEGLHGSIVYDRNPEAEDSADDDD